MDKIAAERLAKLGPKIDINSPDDAKTFLDAICRDHPEIALQLPLPPSIVTKNKQLLRPALRELNKKRAEFGFIPQRLIDQWESDLITTDIEKLSVRQKQELAIWRDIKFKIEEVECKEWTGPSVAEIIRDAEGLPPLVLSDTISESKCQIEDHTLESSLDLTK